MRIAVLGTGTVGKAIGSKLAALGHEVTMGSRTADNEAAAQWAADVGNGASHATIADSAHDADLVFNCTAGVGSLDALTAAGVENLAGKTIVDVANPLDFSGGPPPTLSVANTDSLAEQAREPGSTIT